MNFNFYSSAGIFDVPARAHRIHQLKHVQLHGQLPAEFIYGSRGQEKETEDFFFFFSFLHKLIIPARGNVKSVANEPVRQRREP